MRTHPPRVGLGLYRSRPSRDLLENALSLGVRHIDTAFSYHQFTGPRDLASAAGDLLPEFTVSAKVGFFPGGRHSLDPRDLTRAAAQCRDDLGITPRVVMLHNPEHTLKESSPAAARRSLEAACAALAQTAEDGACGGWGISAWDAASLVPVVTALPLQARPDVLMVRAGLTVSARQLRSARDLIRALRPRTTWGMSPFGGAPRDPVWDAIDAGEFLRNCPPHDRHQAAFRVAACLPPVDLVMVGTSSPDHLRKLATAAGFPVDEAMIDRYTVLLDARTPVRVPSRKDAARLASVFQQPTPPPGNADDLHGNGNPGLPAL